MASENINKYVDVPCKMSADIQVSFVFSKNIIIGVFRILYIFKLFSFLMQVTGMLAYYILSGGHHPFGQDFECEFKIYHGKYSLEHVRDVLANNLIEWMLKKNPEERPTVKQCLAHPFFWSRLRY